MRTKKEAGKKVLVFSAHPDDHLCCAGTLMFLQSKGFSVTEVVLTGGESSIWLGNTNKGKKIDGSALKRQRRQELVKASQIIGIKKTIFLGLPDSGVKRSISLIEEIIRVVRQERPHILITQNPNDYHHDHREIGRVSTEAVERAAWGIARELGEPYRVPLVLYMEGSYFGRSDLLVDIANYLKRKREAFAAYGSQLNERGYKMLEAMNTYRGYYKRSRAAECFEVPEELPIFFNELVEIFSNVE